MNNHDMYFDKEKMISNSVFYNLVRINKAYSIDNCEYEVTENAMRFYLNYDCFKDWRMEKDNRRRGAYLLRNKDLYYLTADIITSITKPLEVATGKELNGQKGEIIVNAILNNPRLSLVDGNGRGGKEKLKIPEGLLPAVKAFAMVYYWIGNMMPTGSNFSPGGGNVTINDTWNEKLSTIVSYFEDENTWKEKPIILKTAPSRNQKQKTRWPAWINACWKQNELDTFIEQYYFQDLFIGSRIKRGIDVNSDDRWFDWFLENTKIIIQRSYRIVFDFKMDWNNSLGDLNNVRSIIAHVFEEAGIEINEQNLEMF